MPRVPYEYPHLQYFIEKGLSRRTSKKTGLGRGRGFRYGLLGAPPEEQFS